MTATRQILAAVLVVAVGVAILACQETSTTVPDLIPATTGPAPATQKRVEPPSSIIKLQKPRMLGPVFFRQALFPKMKAIADAARKVDAPFIYHSDGRLFQVFDDLHAIGVRGIQPLEPKSMDPLDIKKRWPGKFCLLGNIDLDLMSRGTPDQVEKLVREKIQTLNAGGGYMPGISNTVPHYVKTENYLRMLKTIQSYPD